MAKARHAEPNGKLGRQGFLPTSVAGAVSWTVDECRPECYSKICVEAIRTNKLAEAKRQSDETPRRERQVQLRFRSQSLMNLCITVLLLPLSDFTRLPGESATPAGSPTPLIYCPRRLGGPSFSPVATEIASRMMYTIVWKGTRIGVRISNAFPLEKEQTQTFA